MLSACTYQYTMGHHKRTVQLQWLKEKVPEVTHAGHHRFEAIVIQFQCLSLSATRTCTCTSWATRAACCGTRHRVAGKIAWTLSEQQAGNGGHIVIWNGDQLLTNTTVSLPLSAATRHVDIGHHLRAFVCAYTIEHTFDLHAPRTDVRRDLINTT